MRRRPSRASANATRHESHLTSAESPRPRPCVARNVSARWRRRCPSRARRRRTMPPPRTRASPPAPSRIAACTAPLLAFEGLAGEASLASCRPSSSARRRGRGPCGGVLCATWCLARRQTYAGPALSALPPCRHVASRCTRHTGDVGSGQRRRYRFCSPARRESRFRQDMRIESVHVGSASTSARQPRCPRSLLPTRSNPGPLSLLTPQTSAFGNRPESASGERMHRCTPPSSALRFSR